MKDKNKKNSKKAFTLIEILLIVAIISILAAAILVSVNSARVRAKDSSFKATAKSIQTNLTGCCTNIAVALPNSGPSGIICSGGSNYPDADSMKSVAGSVICGGGGFFQKIIEPGNKNSGNCTDATITDKDIIYNGC